MIVGLDIGTSKVVALVGEVNAGGIVEIQGTAEGEGSSFGDDDLQGIGVKDFPFPCGTPDFFGQGQYRPPVAIGHFQQRIPRFVIKRQPGFQLAFSALQELFQRGRLQALQNQINVIHQKYETPFLFFGRCYQQV